MTRLIIAIACLMALATPTPSWAVDGGRFGQVRLAEPPGTARAYVVLFSDSGGWKEEDQRALDALAAQGSLAVGVDLDTYLSNVVPLPRPGVRPCSDLVGDVEGLSQKLQRGRVGDNYHFPILVGMGAGGALAQLILAGSPPHTIAGAVTIDPQVQTPQGLSCSVLSTVITSGNRFGTPPLTTNGFWSVGLTPQASPLQRAAVQLEREQGTPIDVNPEMGTDRARALAMLVLPHLEKLDLQGFAALPLVPLPVSTPSRTMAVMLSGDGGWRDLDRSIGRLLQHDGVPVLGWDSLRYFWHRKTPAQTAADLATAIRSYQAKWHATKVALIGYSFGADVLAATYNALPPDTKTDIVMLSFLGVGAKADWEIRISDWLGIASHDAIPIAPELAKIPGGLIQCFYGENDPDTSCPSLDLRKTDVFKTDGGHHFNGEYLSIANEILMGLRKREGTDG